MNKTFVSAGMSRSLNARIGAHVRAWERLKNAKPGHPHEHLPFVTIAREAGCQAHELADELTELLNERCRPVVPWRAYDHELVNTVAKELHVAREIIESIDGRRRSETSELFDTILNRHVDEGLVFRKIAEVMRSLATHGNVVLVGRSGQLITQDLKAGLHLRLTAPRDWRIHRVAVENEITVAEATKYILQEDEDRERFVQTFFVCDANHFQYDLVLDNSRFNLAQEAEIIFSALGAKFGETLVGN